VRAWTVNGNGLDTLEGAPYNLASPAVTPDNTTPGLGGSSSTLSYMTNAIHWNLNDSQEWASNGGLSDPPYPTNYRTTYAVEYRGSIQIPSDGVYRFATSSDDRSALWIDPSSDNPAYAEAIVQNRFDQGVTRRSSGQVSLNAGYHDIIVRFAQGGGGHGLYVEWDPTGGTTFADIPGIRYFHGGIVAGPFNQPATGLTTVATGELTFPAGDNHLGALTLGGDGTELTLSGATTVTFEGDVLGTGTTAVTLNGPALVLAGTSVDAVGAADVLSLPAAGFAASAVSVNAGGAGTVVFTDAMSFSAPGASLTVEGGNLRVDGALDGAAVTVEAGGWLRGTGPIRGLVTVTADAAIAPGDTAGTLTVESTVILEDGAVLAFDLDTPNAAAGAGGNDWLSVTDQLVLSPGVRLAIEPGASFGEGVYHLIGFGSLLDNSGGFHNWGISGADGYGFQFLLQGGSLDLRIFENVIPEPASVLRLVCGALGLFHRRR